MSMFGPQNEWLSGNMMQLQKRQVLLCEMWGSNWSTQLNKCHSCLRSTAVLKCAATTFQQWLRNIFWRAGTFVRELCLQGNVLF